MSELVDFLTGVRCLTWTVFYAVGKVLTPPSLITRWRTHVTMKGRLVNWAIILATMAYSATRLTLNPSTHFFAHGWAFGDWPSLLTRHVELLVLATAGPVACLLLLPTRNATAWAHSTAHWGAMNKRFTRCQLPSVGAPRDASAAEGAAFYERVTRRAREMLTRAEKTHGLRWVEFDITDPAAGELLAATVPGGGRAACWGQRNTNTKPGYAAAKPTAKHHSA